MLKVEAEVFVGSLELDELVEGRAHSSASSSESQCLRTTDDEQLSFSYCLHSSAFALPRH